MALRKPLVLVAGEMQQLQPGDSLSGPFTEVDTVVLTNGDATSHVLGEIVYISAVDTGKRAKADAVGTKEAIAFAMGAITNGTTGNYQTGGILAGLSGLTVNAPYYLSAATAGAMTTAAPSAAGQYVVRLGLAISATELMINIERSVLL